MANRNENTRLDLDDEQTTDGPVECLGMTFPSDEARREHFLEILREKLQDPDFRSIEGFPIGDDEDILALSDPPYYTACPNPFIEDFIEHYGTPYDPETDDYHREPFAADVSEGKNNRIYNAHTYHTKVPHRAIMRYILHYTEPGDVVFDGFCGSGMTGIAAQMCGDKDEIGELDLRLASEGIVQDEDGQAISQFGPRTAILNDLSPASSLIAAGYNLSSSSAQFAELAGELLERFEEEYGWLYETTDPDTGDTCSVDYFVWSEMFTCPECSGEIDFWAVAYDEETGDLASKIHCPHCSVELTKRRLERKTVAYFDEALQRTRSRPDMQLVQVVYSHRGDTKRKRPDAADMAILERVPELLRDLSYPTDLIMSVPEGEDWGDLHRGYHEGISRAHDFYLPRQLVTYSVLWAMLNQIEGTEMQRLWRFLLQCVSASFTVRNRFLKNAYSQVNRALSGTLYVGSSISEPSPTYALSGKISRFANAVPRQTGPVSVSAQSLSEMLVPDQSVDYIFLDPPFGDNLPYSELNFLWEAWLGTFTNTGGEAIVSDAQGKNLVSYTTLMTACMEETYRVLKPGRWVTVEFHNSRNDVWMAIQESLGRAGFVVVDVRVLDKGMLTKKQLNSGAVDKDLVISAYKPNGGLEERFELEAGTEEGVWDFIRSHLRQLPVFVSSEGQGEALLERTDKMLYDRMVAFHVQRGVTIPMSAGEFYAGLRERFPERDDMFFLPVQAAEYDNERMTVDKVTQPQIFVTDEASAIHWLRQQLRQKPQTYQDLCPQFMQQLQAWDAHEQQLELSDILRQNFLRYDGDGEVPSQIHSYLSSNYHSLRGLEKDAPSLIEKAKDRWYVPDPNKEADLEKLRHRALMREFEEYRESEGKLKTVRTEALRAGFKECWQNGDYQTIVDVAERLPDEVVQEDSALLMYYDNALMRTEG